MKRLLDRTGLKVVAYLLFFVFAVLTVAGSAGIVYLAEQDVYLTGGAANRENLYRSQAVDIGNEVYMGYDAFLQGDIEDFGAWLNETMPPENGYGITVSDRSGGEVLGKTALPTDAQLVYTDSENMRVGGQDITVMVSLQEGFLPRTYEYRLGLWLLDMQDSIIVLTALFAALTLLCLFWLMAAAGHWPGYGEIHLTWLDRIPLDVFALIVICSGGLCIGTGYVVEIFFGVLTLNLALLFLISFAARCKAGTLLKNNVISYVIRWIWRAVKGTVRWALHIIRGIPLVWKTALVLAGIFLLDLLIGHPYGMTLGAALFYLLVGVAVLGIALNLRTLQKGAEALAQGNYSQPVCTKWMWGDLRRHGENLNAIQQGVQKAVDERLRSERMKTELITNVSHDIKTPLTSIVNYVDLLKKEEIHNPKAQEYLEVLDRQSKRLKKLTEDLVEASKASSGVMPVNLQRTDINVLLSQLEGEYGERLEKSELSLIIHPAAGEPAVMADGKLLSRVMDNLMNNICKYAMPGTRVYAAAAADEQEATVSIKNVSRNELNISAEDLMERFVRGDSSRHTEGSGLGLSIAKSLVELQGGRFELSIDGDLFRADISLPLCRQ